MYIIVIELFLRERNYRYVFYCIFVKAGHHQSIVIDWKEINLKMATPFFCQYSSMVREPGSRSKDLGLKS